jgi:hypothetical protein
MFASLIKRRIHRELRKRGLVIKRVVEADIPPIFEDPLEALHCKRGGKPAAFKCPIDLCIFKYGFRFGSQGWHHYSATLEEYVSGEAHRYEESILKQYYEQWQPTNAVEALIANLGPVSDELQSQPAFAFLLPWTSGAIDERIASKRAIEEAEDRAAARKYGIEGAMKVVRGFNNHGPVHPLKGEIEYRRLIEIYMSLQESGYDRLFGDIGVIVIRRDDEMRYLVRYGNHRLAAMNALGEVNIPATFGQLDMLDSADAYHWPQVRRGVWSRENAVRYIDHLFDFDSRSWARARGLL